MSALAAVRAQWGRELPGWLLTLAEECDNTSQARTAKRIGYSPTTVNQVLRGSYKGDLGTVEAAVRGALLGAVLTCPVLDEITTDKCLREQRRPLTPTSPQRVRVWRACRAGCPHSKIGGARA